MASDSVVWGVMDEDTGYVHEGFMTEQEARDWSDPNVGNPNWGNWSVVYRKASPWVRV